MHKSYKLIRTLKPHGPFKNKQNKNSFSNLTHVIRNFKLTRLPTGKLSIRGDGGLACILFVENQNQRDAVFYNFFRDLIGINLLDYGFWFDTLGMGL